MAESDVNIDLWKTKRILSLLKSASGNGTSMVSLILPPGESIAKMSQKLTEEYGTATNIKSRVNRHSVQSAIMSAIQRLKLYHKCPPNGLCIYTGDVMDSDKKEKKIVIDFEPFKPINTKLYLCDNKFHVEALEDLLLDEKTFAFIIVDGNGYTLATLSGNTRNIIDEFSVDLPSKTSRGGQSSNRYARIRDIAKHEYVKKVIEKMHKNLLKDEKVPFEAIIVAGNAEIKNDVYNCGLLDPRIKNKIMQPMYDVSYGGANGLNQAISLCRDKLGNMKFVEEKQVLEDYFDKIAKDGNITFGIKDTMNALEAGACDYLIIWEHLPIERWVVSEKNETGEEKIDVLYVDPTTKSIPEQKPKEKLLLLDWLIDNRMKFGAGIKFVSDGTGEGAQFVKGFGGVGSVLRYKLDMSAFAEDDEFEEDDMYFD